MNRRSRTASIIVVALFSAGSAWGQNPPPTPQPVLDFNRAISDDLEAKTKTVGERTNDTGTVQIMGEILVRDTYVTQLTTFADKLEALKADEAALKSTLQELRQQAGELEDAYVNMLATEGDIARFEGTHSRVDLSQHYEDQMASAARSERIAGEAAAQGNAGAADYWRQDAAATRADANDSLYALYLRRRQYFFQLLDQNPMLGLGEHNVVMLDRYLFHELMHTMPGTHMDTFVDFIDGAVEEARDEAKRAAAINTEEDLVEFGGPKYQRQRETIAETGTALGTPFPGQLADAAAGRYEQVEGESAVMNAGIDMSLGVIAAGSAIIPGVGPLISGGAAAIMVVRSGNDLVVAVLDEQQAAKLGPVTGYVRLLTAEDKADAAAGNFVLTVAGALLDGANAVRVIRGAPAGAVADAAGATTKPVTSAAGAVDSVPPGVAPTRTASGAVDTPTVLEPPPAAGAGPSTAAPSGGAAPLATRPTPRSAGTIDDNIRRAQESAARNGVDPRRVDRMVADAKGDYTKQGAGDNFISNPVAEANSSLGDIADLDLTRQRALASGIPAGEVDAIIKRTVDAVNNGDIYAFHKMRRELAVTQLNQNGYRIFVDPDFAAEFNDMAVAAASRVDRTSADLTRLNTRVILASQGRLSDALTAEELALLAQLQAQGDDLYKWIEFAPDNSFQPVFTKDFLDRVRQLFPDGIPAAPRPGTAAAAGTGPAAGSVDAAPGSIPPGVRAVESAPPNAPGVAPDETPTNLGGRQPAPSGLPDDTPTNLGGNRVPSQPVGSTTSIDPGITKIDPGQTKIMPNGTVLEPPAAPPGNTNVPASGVPDDSPTVLLPGNQAGGSTTFIDPGITKIDPNQTTITPNGTVLDPRGFAAPVVVGGAVTVGAAGMSSASAAEKEKEEEEEKETEGAGVDPGADIVTTLPGIDFAIGPPSERGKPSRTSLTAGGTVTDGGPDEEIIDLGGGSLTGDPGGCCTPGVQVMTLDLGEPVSVPPTTQVREEASLRLSLPWAARNLLAMVKTFARGTNAFAATNAAATDALALANRPIGMPPAFTRLRSLEPVGASAGQAPTAPGPISTILTANGNSQGEAFEMTIINNGRSPLKILGSGVVVEPIKRELQNQVRQQLSKLMGSNAITRRVEAYCLQYALAPPTPGMLFQIAGPALQDKFKPAGLIMNAARQLGVAGALNPDSNPKSYLESIKQYAIWTKFENWDMKKFGEMLLNKTKEAALAAKANWTGQMQSALLSAVPNRWRDIQTVLSTAQELAARPQ